MDSVEKAMNRNREEFNHGGSVFLGKHRHFPRTDGGMDN
jgi:hypothetical protein